MLKELLQKNKIIFVFIAVLLAGLPLAEVAFAAHVSANISTASNERYAWNDVISWIDFGKGEVEVTDSELRGYTSSSIGFIALNCATTPSPPAPTCVGPAGNWGVVNDGNGNLSGWAWNDNIGWISFFGSVGGFLGPFSYQVVIDPSDGTFNGWAWNDIVGWISFNCNNTGTCAPSPPGVDYKVKTSWSTPPVPPPPPPPPPLTFGSLESSTFDTRIDGGVALNTIMWLGEPRPNTVVQFQIASSNNLSDPWNFLGDDGTTVSYYTSGPGVQMPIRRLDHNNVRYFRYKIFISAIGQSPRVDDVIINYSP
ncbi:MAG: hypothetical protein HYT03_03480 [Candidatus Harrisonbacteria bacterium]|nr:hypothetical protein [Candidatus Harrisonbacteria bacterium]